MRILFIAVIIALLASSATAAPQLLSGSVTYTGTDTDSTYVFSVTYKGNASATDMSIIINGAANPMVELDPLDTDSTDGKIYYFETKLDAGVNTYSFRCADASGTNTTASKMLLVKDVPAFQFSHLDVMLAVLIWIPFVVYFMYLARKMTKTLERIDKRGEGRQADEDMACSPTEHECLEECMCEFRDGKTVSLDELKREKD